jgi:hypothetical protein
LPTHAEQLTVALFEVRAVVARDSGRVVELVNPMRQLDRDDFALLQRARIAHLLQSDWDKLSSI